MSNAVSDLARETDMLTTLLNNSFHLIIHFSVTHSIPADPIKHNELEQTPLQSVAKLLPDI